MNKFLPITKEEMLDRGWEQPDFVYVIGDAYVDQSSFGPAIISRVLESHGYKVAIISQPDYTNSKSVTLFGRPRYGFLVSAGNMDSMVNHYTSSKKHRSTDSYSPGGKMGLRPDNATIVYSNLIKKEFKGVPVIIGGVEASLRRLGHYDYWSNKMKRSILLDSGADLLLYGMGELSIVEVADALSSGIDISDITYVNGTVYKARDYDNLLEPIILPSFDQIKEDKKSYAESFAIQYNNFDHITGRPLVESYGEHRYIIQNPPMRPLTQKEMDEVYELPYMNAYHPSYEKDGGIPAINEVKFSLTSSRGCFGTCSFCAIAFHEGRTLQTRSHESLVREAKQFVGDKDFKGYIHDVGGPTANFRKPSCKKQSTCGMCTDKACLYPKPCKNLDADNSDYLLLLKKLRKIDGVKKVFIRSGIRYDYLLAGGGDELLKEICEHHVSGQLRVAPEHVSSRVLKVMGKPEYSVYERFKDKFDKMSNKLGKKQYVVPYLISSHPGSTLEDAIMLAEAVRDMGYMPEQVQDFYPTPSSISTVAYYTGYDPRDMSKVYVPTSATEKKMQKALIQYRNPDNYDLVKSALIKAGRDDLIGFGKECLVPPRKIKKYHR